MEILNTQPSADVAQEEEVTWTIGQQVSVRRFAVLRWLGAGMVLGISIATTISMATTLHWIGRGSFPSVSLVHASSTLFSGEDDASLAHEHYMIEDVTLPTAGYEETHEIHYDSMTHTAFISQIVASRMLQVGFNGPHLTPSARRWTVGNTTSGLHSVQGSRVHPGQLWITLQFDDLVCLVDPANGMRVRHKLTVPTLLRVGELTAHVGGPHAAVEAADGSIWVGLKASNDGSSKGTIGLTAADQPSQAWAVWHVHPDQYDPASDLEAHGGKLYPAMQSPTMIAVDGENNAFISLDRVDRVMRVTPNVTSVGLKLTCR